MSNKLFAALAVVAIAGCSQAGHQGDVLQMPTSGPIAETVNGIAIPQSLLESVARTNKLHLDNAQQREQALTLVADMVLVAQASQHEAFASTEAFQADVEAARLKGMADASFGEFQKTTPISDDMLKAEYDAQSTKTGNQIYDFGQLLFADEAAALKAEGDVVAGKPFSEVFDTYRATAKQAKVFSRVRPEQVPEPLAKALAALKNGETTKIPVKTEYGYHVVHLDLASPYTPPPFDQVKDGIRRSMQVKIAQDHMKKMHDSAKIEYPAATPILPVAPVVEKKG